MTDDLFSPRRSARLAQREGSVVTDNTNPSSARSKAKSRTAPNFLPPLRANPSYTFGSGAEQMASMPLAIQPSNEVVNAFNHRREMVKNHPPLPREFDHLPRPLPPMVPGIDDQLIFPDVLPGTLPAPVPAPTKRRVPAVASSGTPAAPDSRHVGRVSKAGRVGAPTTGSSAGAGSNPGPAARAARAAARPVAQPAAEPVGAPVAEPATRPASIPTAVSTGYSTENTTRRRTTQRRSASVSDRPGSSGSRPSLSSSHSRDDETIHSESDNAYVEEEPSRWLIKRALVALYSQLAKLGSGIAKPVSGLAGHVSAGLKHGYRESGIPLLWEQPSHYVFSWDLLLMLVYVMIFMIVAVSAIRYTVSQLEDSGSAVAAAVGAVAAVRHWMAGMVGQIPHFAVPDYPAAPKWPSWKKTSPPAGSTSPLNGDFSKQLLDLIETNQYIPTLALFKVDPVTKTVAPTELMVSVLTQIIAGSTQDRDEALAEFEMITQYFLRQRDIAADSKQDIDQSVWSAIESRVKSELADSQSLLLVPMEELVQAVTRDRVVPLQAQVEKLEKQLVDLSGQIKSAGSVVTGNLNGTHAITRPNFLSRKYGSAIFLEETSSDYVCGKKDEGCLSRAVLPSYFVITPGLVHDGECWSPSESTGNDTLGQIMVTAGLPFHLSSTSYHAVRREETVGVHTIPRNFEVWVDILDVRLAEQVRRLVKQVYPDGCVDPPDQTVANMVCVQKFTYDIDGISPFQTFPVPNAVRLKEMGVVVSKMIFRITRAWGTGNPCVHKIGAHGEMVRKPTRE